MSTKITPNEEALIVQQWATEALQVQDASNLSGVVHRFSQILSGMCELGWDTPTRNQHPICQCFADKIAALTRIQYDQGAVFAAFGECELLKKGTDNVVNT